MSHIVKYVSPGLRGKQLTVELMMKMMINGQTAAQTTIIIIYFTKRNSVLYITEATLEETPLQNQDEYKVTFTWNKMKSIYMPLTFYLLDYSVFLLKAAV